jgi:hypothetical protein
MLYFSQYAVNVNGFVRNFLRRKMPQTALFAAKVVRPSGFEPLAFRLGGGRSILLSYGRIWNFWCHWRTNYADLGGGRSIQLSCAGKWNCTSAYAILA